MINRHFSPTMIWSIYMLFSFIVGNIIFLITILCSRRLPSYFIVFAIMSLILTIVRAFYKRTIYKLQEKGVQFERNFITFSRKNIRYSDIKQITLHRSIIQRIFDLGTICVTSHATTEYADITFYNIKNYQEVYDALIEKINR